MQNMQNKTVKKTFVNIINSQCHVLFRMLKITCHPILGISLILSKVLHIYR